MVFLKDAPPPRRFWARRQAHETTIHSVDAVAAALGRWPTASDVTIDPVLAADGIDELLTGFITRGKGRLHTAEPYTRADQDRRYRSCLDGTDQRRADRCDPRRYRAARGGASPAPRCSCI